MDDIAAYDELLEEGAVRHSHRILLHAGRNRFGEPDAKTEAALTAIKDLNRLNRMLGRMIEVKVTVKSWKVLLAVK